MREIKILRKEPCSLHVTHPCYVCVCINIEKVLVAVDHVQGKIRVYLIEAVLNSLMHNLGHKSTD